MICKKTVYALTFICASLQNVQVYASSGAPALTAVQEESKAHCEKYNASCTQYEDIYYATNDGKLTIYGPENSELTASAGNFGRDVELSNPINEIEISGNVTRGTSFPPDVTSHDNGGTQTRALSDFYRLGPTKLTLSGMTEINDYFNGLGNVRDLEIGQGVTSIEGELGLYRVSSLVIPDSVTSISSRAFKKMYNLTNLVIPDGAVIEEEAFFDSITSSVTASAEQLEAYLTAGGLLTPDENGKVNIICTSGDCNTAIRTYFENSNSDAYAVGRNPAGVCIYLNETHTYIESKHLSCTDEDTAADRRQRYIDTILSSLVISRPSSGDEQELPEGCLEMGNNRCVTCDNEHLEKNGSCVLKSEGCGENYKQIENWCNRTRYTPVEAAEILNDNDNSIVITFKLGGK